MTFYDDPYTLIDEAFDAVNAGEMEEAQAHALIAIAIVLLGIAAGDEEDEPDDAVPAGPILYEDYPGGD